MRPLAQGIVHEDYPQFPALFPQSEVMIAEVGLCVLDEAVVTGTFVPIC